MHERTVNLFILGAFSAALCLPQLPFSLFLSKILICVALQRDSQVCTENRDKNREETSATKDEGSSGKGGGRQCDGGCATTGTTTACVGSAVSRVTRVS